MANLLALKRRIKAAQNVSKTTRAMQMIAASKMKRAQEATLATRPYVRRLKTLTENVINKTDESFNHAYLNNSQEFKNNLLIIISPDKGLCGGMITNLVREFRLYQSQENSPEAITIGRKLEGYLTYLGQKSLASFLFGNITPAFDMVYPILRLIDEQYLTGKVGSVKVLYTHFNSIFNQEPKIMPLLPFIANQFTNPEDIPLKPTQAEYLYEPSVNKILPSLLKHTLEMSLYQFLLESFVSEQAARMIAMQNATDNADDIIAELQLDYNKTRQAKITSEILDIGSGAFAGIN